MPEKARPPYPKFNTPYWTRSSAARYEHACEEDKRGGGLGLGGGRAAFWFCRAPDGVRCGAFDRREKPAKKGLTADVALPSAVLLNLA